jgi:hypothetical protein
MASVTHNRAAAAGGGVSVASASSSINADESTIDSNVALRDGGGLAQSQAGALQPRSGIAPRAAAASTRALR